MPQLRDRPHVVEAVGVGVAVWAEATAADSVVDEDVLLALAPAEEHLRPVGLVAVAVVGEVFHVGVHDALRVVDVPAVDDHEDGERFVAQTKEAEALGVGSPLVLTPITHIPIEHARFAELLSTRAAVGMPMHFEPPSIVKVVNSSAELEEERWTEQAEAVAY